MPEIARGAGAKIVEINLSDTPLTGYISDYIVKGAAGEILEQVVAKIKETRT